MSNWVKNLLRYGSCTLFEAAIFAIYLNAWQMVDMSTQDICRTIADCMTVSGVLMLSVAGMLWASNEGALDGVGYVVSFMIRSLIPGRRLERDERYAEYVERRREKPIRGYAFLVIYGGCSLAIGLVFTALFYVV